jgi:hypothetical protein
MLRLGGAILTTTNLAGFCKHRIHMPLAQPVDGTHLCKRYRKAWQQASCRSALISPAVSIVHVSILATPIQGLSLNTKMSFKQSAPQVAEGSPAVARHICAVHRLNS